MTGPAPGDFCCCAAARGTSTASASRPAAMALIMASRPHEFTDFGHADFRADVDEHALRTARVDGPADVLSPRHEIPVDDRPPAARRGRVQRAFGLLGRARAHPSEAIR